MDHDPRARKRARTVQLTERDGRLLAFVSEHRLVLAAHVQTFLAISRAAAYARLRALCAAGLLEREQRLHHQPSCYLVTREGLAFAGSELPRPRFDLRTYEHDVGLAWVWLAARNGTFGPMGEVISERQLRSQDGRARNRDLAAPQETGPSQPLGIRLGGYGPAGRERLHYPDLLLVDPHGHRIAIELELTAKGRTRQEQILAGYAADARTDVILYLVRDPVLARSIATSARRLGISDRVHVQRVRFEPGAKAAATVLAAERTRRPAREREVGAQASR